MVNYRVKQFYQWGKVTWEAKKNYHYFSENADYIILRELQKDPPPKIIQWPENIS